MLRRGEVGEERRGEEKSPRKLGGGGLEHERGDFGDGDVKRRVRTRIPVQHFLSVTMKGEGRTPLAYIHLIQRVPC